MQTISATRFKQLNRNRNVTGSVIAVRKQMIAPASTLCDGVRSLRFTISTDCIDRERDKIAINGWQLDNFARNPIVLWGHDASRLPIGRAFNVGIEAGALKASVEFIPSDTPEAGPFADAVYSLARDGFIAATSVGFRPIKWAFTDDPERGKDDWFPGIDFESQELVELSVVTVPANPEALIEQPLPGIGVPGEIASDTPPGTAESIDHMAADIAAQKARRRRVLALAQAIGRGLTDAHSFASVR